MTPNVYRAADGWTSEDMDVIYRLTAQRHGNLALVAIRTQARLLNWIAEAPTKEPAR